MQLPLIGSTIELHYPTCTDVLASTPKRWHPRQLEIVEIRDLVTDPLTAAEFIRRPFTRRTRYLARAVECGRLKQFYLGTSREYFCQGQLRLGLYDPEQLRLIKLVSRPFENTPYDRRLLYQALLQLSQMEFGSLQLRVFADDLRLHAA